MFLVSFAVLSPELFQSLPGIPDISLRTVAKQHKVTSTKVGELRVIVGSYDSLNKVREGLSEVGTLFLGFSSLHME